MIKKVTPKTFTKALRGSLKAAVPVTLTKMAYEAKSSAPGQIAKDMTLRSRGFISSSIRYNKASSTALKSKWGIVTRERFTGLIEQETGKTEKKRAATLKGSRGGSLQRKVSPKNRLKSGINVATAKNFKRRPRSDIEMLTVFRAVKYKGLFFLPKNAGRKAGIYRFVGGWKSPKLSLIHAVGDIPNPKKRPWMKHTNEELIRKNIGRKTWKKVASKFMSDRIARYSK